MIQVQIQNINSQRQYSIKFSETEEIWENEDAEEQLNEDFADEDSPGVPQVGESDKSVHSLVSWLVLFLLRLQSKYYIPEVAMACLLKFLYAFFVVVGFHSEYVASMVEEFLRSLYCLRKYWNLDADFNRLVVCRKCYSVYEKSSCIEKCGIEVVSKHCIHREHKNSNILWNSAFENNPCFGWQN